MRYRRLHFCKERLTLLILIVIVLFVARCQASAWFWRRWWVRLRAGSSKTKANDGTNSTSAAALSILSPATAIYNAFSSSRNKNHTTLKDDHDETSKRLWSTSRKMTRKRVQFLERLALIASSSSSSSSHDAKSNTTITTTTAATTATASVQDLMQRHNVTDASTVTPDTDLTRPGRTFHIVTTAALPWFTGTAVNPLLRAAYLHRYTQQINSSSSSNSTTKNNSDSLTTKNGNCTASSSRPRNSFVTLVIPWLELEDDQETLYGRVFASEAEQEAHIRQWLRDEADMHDVAEHLEMVFYPARYHAGLGSIFAMGDIIETIAASSANSNNSATAISTTMDVCVLEEPEHCNWYRAPGRSWMQRFNFVVGIVHTNYKEYASAHYSGLWTAPAISLISSAMVRAYCHKVIKLSDTLQSYAVEKETTSNVHGVRSNFWQEGLRRSRDRTSWETEGEAKPQVYFVGKLLWAKGLDLLLELEDYYKQCTGEFFPITIYGSGPDQRAIVRAFHGRRNSVHANPEEEAQIEAEYDDVDETKAWGLENHAQPKNGVGRFQEARQKFAKLTKTITADALQEKTMEKIAKIKDSLNSVELPKRFSELRRQPIPASFPGRVDHGELTDYKIFVNPSISEVLCTTTAEALAMGKFAIIPVHPSNTFFLQFPNCLAYRNKFEFIANLRWALTHNPEPLTEEQARTFTWEAATERLVQASAITWREALERERLGLAKLDERIAWFHNELGKGSTGDFIRKVLGAGPVSHQVKYQKDNAVSNDADGELSEYDDDDEEDESATKFQRSSFVQAIRDTLGDVSMFALQ